MKKIILVFCSIVSFVILIFIFSSDSPETKFNKVSVENKFSISVPEYLTKTNDIDSSALLQFKNEGEQLFLLVYENADSSSLENFFKKFSADLVSKLENGIVGNYYPENIDGTNALVGNIKGRVNETRVNYKIAAIRVNNSFYKIVIGMAEEKRLDHEEDFDIILSSFKK